MSHLWRLILSERPETIWRSLERSLSTRVASLGLIAIAKFLN